MRRRSRKRPTRPLSVVRAHASGRPSLVTLPARKARGFSKDEPSGRSLGVQPRCSSAVVHLRV